MANRKQGFTIVELLIVIVVIAILAAISIVAYNGIQQRANNTKTITAANQVVKAISGYIAANGTYPSTGIYCIVPSDNTACTVGNSTNRTIDTTLMNNLQTISTLPSSSVASANPNYDGITYVYQSTKTFNGSAAPLMVIYTLRGDQQQCSASNLANNLGLTGQSSTTGWSGSGGGYTSCGVSISGPSS